jgi:hypothetical protein
MGEYVASILVVLVILGGLVAFGVWDNNRDQEAINKTCTEQFGQEFQGRLGYKSPDLCVAPDGTPRYPR